MTKFQRYFEKNIIICYLTTKLQLQWLDKTSALKSFDWQFWLRNSKSSFWKIFSTYLSNSSFSVYCSSACVGWEAVMLLEEILLGWVSEGRSPAIQAELQCGHEHPKIVGFSILWNNFTKIFFTLTALLKARFDGLQETGGTTEDIWRPASFPWGFAQVTSLPYRTLLVNISQLNHLEGTTRCFALGILSGRITFQLELTNIPNLSWNQLNSLQLHCFQPHLSKTPLFCHLYPVQWKCKSFLEV